MKRCAKCREDKPLTEFSRSTRAKDGRQSWCKRCARERNIEWLAENPEKQRQYDAAAYAKNPLPKLERGRRWRAELRAEVHAAYGDECSCCGEMRTEFLTLDHIGGRRGAHVGATTYEVFVMVKREGFPTDLYRLLCWNCNMAHGIYGYCPHDNELRVVANGSG